MDTSRSSRSFAEFLKDLEQWKDAELLRQAPQMVGDERLLGQLMEFLLSDLPSDEQTLLERFYLQLHRCYLTTDDNLLKFVNQFIFCLIWRHFNDLSRSRQFGTSIRPGLDALLIALYNLMIVDNENQPKVQTIRIPTLATSSIYHDASEFTTQILRDATRTQGQPEQEKRVFIGPYPPIETLTRTKKWTVFRVLLRDVSADLPYNSKTCQKSCILLCRMLFAPADPHVSRPEVELVAKRETKLQDRLHFKNFSINKDKNSKSQAPRLIMAESFLLDILDVLYVLAFQGFFEESLGLVNDILEEGQYRLLAAVVLLGSAVKNRLVTSKAEPDDLDEIPPIIPNIAVDEPRKVSSGSMRDKRRKSIVIKKDSINQKGDALTEKTEVTDAVDGGSSTRPDTPEESRTDNGETRSKISESRYRESPQSARSTVAESVV